MQQIAMCRVNLDDVESRFESAVRRGAETLDETPDARPVNSIGCGYRSLNGDRAGRNYIVHPPSATGTTRSGFQGTSILALRPGMSKLNPDTRALLVDEADDLAQFRDVFVLPQAQVGRRDSSFRRNGCRFNDNQAGSPTARLPR